MKYFNTTTSTADESQSDLYGWLTAATALERSAAIRKLVESLPPGDHLSLPSVGSTYAVLDDIMLPRSCLTSADFTAAKIRRADLRGADFEGARLQRTDFGGAKLRNANFALADLRKADLAAADLTGADLCKANLSSALCEETLFVRAKLRFADMQEAACEHANFNRADMWGADLRKADCGRADIRRAVFKEADARGGTFSGADFRRADLTRTDFCGADLSRADLRGAAVTGADFRDANLQHARLDGLNLTTVSLTGARLSGARLEGSRLDWHQLGDRIGEEVMGDVEGARGAYLALERIFAVLGDPVAASWAYCRRRRMQKSHSWKLARQRWLEGKSWAAMRCTTAAAGDQCVEWVCDYGESMGRVIFLITVVLIGFAILYGITGSVVRVEKGLEGSEVRTVTTAPSDLVVFSLLALTTSGSPAVGLFPRDQFVHFLTGVQALFGIGLTGLLGFVAGNRIRR